jgi:hypothetical protein
MLAVTLKLPRPLNSVETTELSALFQICICILSSVSPELSVVLPDARNVVFASASKTKGKNSLQPERDIADARVNFDAEVPAPVQLPASLPLIESELAGGAVGVTALLAAV